ncbi:Fumarate reductase (CoM/CoB) subunit B [uncultured archaeon]|nr:Fumarate reductase (CoM/CoB) subunit B [uncultured archaeon]
MKEVKLVISRYDPAEDDRPHYEKYIVPWKYGLTVLDALNYIKENIDSSLSFRQGCRSAICGSCALRVDKRGCLACKTMIAEKTGEIIIDPLNHYKVIRDLVVDLTPFYERMKQIQPYLVRNNTVQMTGKEMFIRPEALAEAKNLRDCILCGSCHSDCNTLDVDNTFCGPAALVKALRFASDPRDENKGRLAQAVELGLYKCPVDQECEFACPKEINIRRGTIERLRYLAVKNELAPLPEHKKLINSVLSTGGIVPVKAKPTTEMFPEYIKKFNGEPQAEVLLFLGCIINRRKQNVAEAIINIFQNNHVAVHLPGKVTCCGSPFMRIGQRDSMRPFVEKNFSIFNEYASRGITDVVTSCSGCNSTFRHDFPKLAREFEIPLNFRIYDVGEYMSEKIVLDVEGLKSTNIRAMYHYPCHIRASGLAENIYINLIQKIPGVELVKVPKSGYCCGGGGGVRAAFPDLADRLAIRRIEIAKESGIDTLITNCPFCVLSFERVLQLKEETGEKMEFRIIDFYEMFSEAYGSFPN